MAGLLPFEFPLESEPSPMEIDLEADFPTPPRSQTTSPVQESRPRQLRRTTMIPLTICHNLPQTSTEWKRLLAQVKRDYQNGRYRACLTRCSEVLDNIRQLVRYSRPFSAFGCFNQLLTYPPRLTCKLLISFTCTSMPLAHLRCNSEACNSHRTVSRC